MKSCFGGLAIYKFDDIIESECEYHITRDLQTKAISTWNWFKQQDSFKRGDQSICEHIAFHNCLREYVGKDFKMIFSRNSYVYYQFEFHHGWQRESIVQSRSY